MKGGTRSALLVGGALIALGGAGLAVVGRSAEPESPAEASAGTAEPSGPDAKYLPQFTPDGALRRPEGWETWVLAGTSMGLTYAENPRTFAPGEAPGSFLQVYIQPWAYESFMEDGAFPQGTMFILAGSEPVSRADPARGGFYQGDLHLMEVHLKQDGIDPTGWAFYGFGGDAESAEKIPEVASCYSCHAESADYDHVFVQFYPRMRERLGGEPVGDPDAGMPASPGEGVAQEGGE